MLGNFCLQPNTFDIPCKELRGHPEDSQSSNWSVAKGCLHYLPLPGSWLCSTEWVRAWDAESTLVKFKIQLSCFLAGELLMAWLRSFHELLGAWNESICNRLGHRVHAETLGCCSHSQDSRLICEQIKNEPEGSGGDASLYCSPGYSASDSTGC